MTKMRWGAVVILGGLAIVSGLVVLLVSKSRVVDQTPNPAHYEDTAIYAWGYQLKARVELTGGAAERLLTTVTVGSWTHSVDMQTANTAANPSDYVGRWLTHRAAGACGFTVQHSLTARFLGVPINISSAPSSIAGNADDQGTMFSFNGADLDFYLRIPSAVSAVTTRERWADTGVQMTSFYPTLTVKATSISCGTGQSCTPQLGVENISLPSPLPRSLGCGDSIGVGFNCNTAGLGEPPAKGTVVFDTDRAILTVPFRCGSIGA